MEKDELGAHESKIKTNDNEKKKKKIKKSHRQQPLHEKMPTTGLV